MILKLNPNYDLGVHLHTRTAPLGGGGGGGGNGRGRKIGRGSGGLTTSLSQYNGKVDRKVVFFFGGGGGVWMAKHGAHDVRGVRGGGLKNKRLRSGFVEGRVFRVNIVLFLFKTEGPKTRREACTVDGGCV